MYSNKTVSTENVTINPGDIVSALDIITPSGVPRFGQHGLVLSAVNQIAEVLWTGSDASSSGMFVPINQIVVVRQAAAS
jgi:hypothetical protein